MIRRTEPSGAVLVVAGIRGLDRMVGEPDAGSAVTALHSRMRGGFPVIAAWQRGRCPCSDGYAERGCEGFVVQNRGGVNVSVTASAVRHGVDGEAIRHAVAHAMRIAEMDGALMIIGAEQSGRLLEPAAKEGDPGTLVVFPAMRLRSTVARRFV